MIRQISNKVDIAAAPNLIWETFLQFEAPGYSDEGVKSFIPFTLLHMRFRFITNWALLIWIANSWPMV